MPCGYNGVSSCDMALVHAVTDAWLPPLFVLRFSLFFFLEQVKKGADDHPILQHVHGLYHDLGIQDLTVQTDFV